MTDQKRSVYNLISATIGQVLGIAIGFLLPGLMIAHFGDQINGFINSINQLLVYLGLFEAGVGLVTMQALYGPVARKDWDAINGVLSATHVYYRRASLFYLLGLMGLGAVYPLVVQVNLPWLSVFLSVVFCGMTNVLSFYVHGKYVLFLRAKGKSYVLSNLGTLVAVLSGLSKAGLILLGYDVVTVLGVGFSVHLIQAGYITWYINRRYPKLSVVEKPDYQAIAQKNHMLFHQVSWLICQHTDLILLTLVSGLKVVSIYSIYKLVMTQLAGLTFIVQNSFDFMLGQMFHTNKERFKKWIDVFESYFSALNFAAYAVIFHVLYAFVSLYTKGLSDLKYADHWLVALFVTIELLTIMRMPMLQTIHYAGHIKRTNHHIITETVINLVISLFAVFRYGMYGVLVGTAIALLYRTNAIILYANKKLLSRSSLRTYVIHALNIALFFALQWVFSSLFAPISAWVDLIWVGAVAGVISLVAYMLMQTLAWADNREIVWGFARKVVARFR